MNLTTPNLRLGSYHFGKYSAYWRWVMVMLLWAQISVANANLWESLAGQKPQGPLPVEEAYLFSYSQPEPGLLILQWTMPESDYYLYRDQIKLHTDGQVEIVDIQKGLTVGKEDAIYGQSQVYYNEAEFRVAVQQSAAGNPDPEIRVEYQGCWDGGICYPPQTQPVQLISVPTQAPPLTPADSSAQPAVVESNALEFSLTDQRRFSDVLASGSFTITLLLFFLAGLALSLTPCVFPMIPILSSVIVGHGGKVSTRQAFGYSSIYVLAMAITYTLAGVAAGLFGANIQAAFQNPWIISTFSLMFVVFAFSMFGFFEIQMPTALQNRLANLSRSQQGGRGASVFVMGVLSALIVGPCVAAPLAGALVYIGQTGDPILGGAALFSLSLGMGVPLIIIGTSAGKLLPKAGHWMVHIKAGFGVIMLLMAIWMLDRIVPPTMTVLLVSAVLIISSIYLKALDRLPEGCLGWLKLGKGFGVLMLIYGTSLLVGVAAGNASLLKPLAGVVTGSATSASSLLPFAKVTSLDQLRPLVEQARTQGRPVMLDFYADWCITCKELESFVFVDPSVQAEFQRFTLIKVDVTANDDAAIALNKEYDLIGPPAQIFYGPQGNLLTEKTLIGVPKVADFVSLLRSI
mgnify:FL=1|tara:strand:- start:1120 stop:3009 length:1890 start_codon:yes stop_codon:yes gene_type:complete